MNPNLGIVFTLAAMFCLIPGGNPAVSAELTGMVRANRTLVPLEGARISLGLRSGVAFSRADGSFTLPFDLSAGIAAPQQAGRPELRNGRFVFHADAGGNATLELFDLAGKRLASRKEPVLAPGNQSLDVTGLLTGLRGLGWLRVTTAGRTESFRVCKPGIADRAVLGLPGASARRAAPGAQPAAAKQALTEEVLDTLRVELPGYLSEKFRVTRDALSAGQVFWAELMKNSLYGLDSGAVSSWKAFLEKPVQRIILSRYFVSPPANSAGTVVVTADGREVERWGTMACYPEAPPRSMRFAYTRDGREYRDTLDLAPFWAFHESFRAQVDSLGPSDFRANVTWEWPEGVSIVPERDVLELFHAEHFVGQHYATYPDVYLRAQLPLIDGPQKLYGEPDPRSGNFMMPGRTSALIGYMAHFTLARREGHDLRVQLEWRPYPPQPAKLEFLTGWPADGIVRPDQVLQLQGRFQPGPGPQIPGGNIYLEMSRSRARDSDGLFFDNFWQIPWDGSPIDWKFPYPMRDTVSFRLRVRKEQTMTCDGLDESPALKFVPDPADTTAGAFEPNESFEDAKAIEKGRWHAAALDFRFDPAGDVDHYRFRGVQGERVRVTLRNRGTADLVLYQQFVLTSSLSAEPGAESSAVYTVSGNGEFDVWVGGEPGRYEFRIDTVQ